LASQATWQAIPARYFLGNSPIQPSAESGSEHKSKRVTGHGGKGIMTSGHEYRRSLYGSLGEWHPVLDLKIRPLLSIAVSA
jgi:hypothetical protein